MRRYLMAAIGVWLLCGGVAWAATNIVNDPGFENSIYPNTFPVTTPPDWVVTKESSGSGFGTSDGTYHTGVHSAGFAGTPNQYVNPYPNPPPALQPYGDFVSQALTTTYGQAYHIGFWINVQDTAGVSTMAVTWGSSSNPTPATNPAVWGYGYMFTNPANYTDTYDNSWTHITVPGMVIGTGSDTILFGGSDYIGEVFVDDVSVTALLPGDANGDGTVNGADLNTVLSNYNQTFTPLTPAAWAAGDFNGDGTVNGADLNTVLSNYNQSQSTTAAVPEPSTLLLLAAGLAGLLAYAWRKRK